MPFFNPQSTEPAITRDCIIVAGQQVTGSQEPQQRVGKKDLPAVSAVRQAEQEQFLADCAEAEAMGGCFFDSMGAVLRRRMGGVF